MRVNDKLKFFVAVIIVTLIATSIYGAKEPPKQRTFNPVIRKVIDYTLPHNELVGSNYDVPSKTKGNFSEGTLSASTSPGVQLGSTYYDQQHLNTTGRMVGVGQSISGSDTNTFVHFTWMTGGFPGPGNTTGAYVYADLGAGTYSGEMNVTFSGSGFFNLDVSKENQAIISGHAVSGSTYPYVPAVWYDSAALAGNFLYSSPIPEPFDPPAYLPRIMELSGRISLSNKGLLVSMLPTLRESYLTRYLHYIIFEKKGILRIYQKGNSLAVRP